MPAYERVAAFIAEHHLLPARARVVVGVSGGPDSLCLVDALHTLGYRVVVAHLDHRLRRGSWRDAEFVLALAAGRGLPAVVERLPDGSLPIPGTTLEEGARVLRYGFLTRVAHQHRAAFIAVGHTADDQAETILMHFLRGAGAHGLRGMLPGTPMEDVLGGSQARGVVLVRPLLTLNRVETEEHCRRLGLRPRRDPTNNDATYFRNRLRRHLLPELETYNPRIRQVLVRLGDVMRAEVAHIESEVRTLLPSTIVERSPGIWAIRRDPFKIQSEAMQAALLREAVGRVAPEARDFGHESLRRALTWLKESRTGKRLALPGRRELVDEGAEIVIHRLGALVPYPDQPQLQNATALQLRVPFRVSLEHGWALVGRARSAVTARAERRNPWIVRFDAGRAGGKLIVHPPQPGARVALGRGEDGKVSDLLINHHIPRGARPRWPIVSDEGGVLWVSGVRRAARAPIGRATRRVLELSLVPPGKERSR